MQLRRFEVIVAIDEMGGIAKNDKIPWDLKEDRAYFQRVTTHVEDAQVKTQEGKEEITKFPNSVNEISKFPNSVNALIMGRRTYELLPRRPLPNRLNVIITSKPISHFGADENILCFSSLVEALYELTKWSSVKKVFICGGSNIYRPALTEFRSYCDLLHVTHVSGDYQCDRFFLNSNSFSNILSKVEKKGIGFEIRIYEPNHEEERYLALIRELREKSKHEPIRPDRTGVGTSNVFVRTLTYDLSKGRIPLLSTKKVNFQHVLGELLWMISANPDIAILQKQGIHIWDANTTREFLDKNHLHDLEKNSIGLLYGIQLRAFNAPYIGKKSHIGYGVDQLSRLINQLREDPYSRRHIVSYYNPSVTFHCLYPCHIFFHAWVTDLPPPSVPPSVPPISISNEGEEETNININIKKHRRGLSLMFFMRSTDVFLGLPYNQVFYSLLTHMIAFLCDMEPLELKVVMDDCHLYSNHWEAADTLLQREPYEFPTLRLVDTENVKTIDDFTSRHFLLSNYKHHPFIKAPMAI